MRGTCDGTPVRGMSLQGCVKTRGDLLSRAGRASGLSQRPQGQHQLGEMWRFLSSEGTGSTDLACNLSPTLTDQIKTAALFLLPVNLCLDLSNSPGASGNDSCFSLSRKFFISRLGHARGVCEQKALVLRLPDIFFFWEKKLSSVPVLPSCSCLVRR